MFFPKLTNAYWYVQYTFTIITRRYALILFTRTVNCYHKELVVDLNQIAAIFAHLSKLQIELCACCSLLGSWAPKQQIKLTSVFLQRDAPEQPGCFLSPPHTSLPPFLSPLKKSNGVYGTSITPLIPLPSYTQRRGLQLVWGRRLQALMWEPGANGSTGYCKVMKGLDFYDDVNDVGCESKRASEHSAVSIYCTWLDCRGSALVLNIYIPCKEFCRYDYPKWCRVGTMLLTQHD